MGDYTKNSGEAMREILFRGKSVNDGRWVFGDLSNYGVCKTITTVKDFRIIDSCEVIPETVGQYTGLKDKNGLTKIFEGDIIIDEDNDVMVVRWMKEYAAFVLEPKPDASVHFYGTLPSRIKVIGNIYDNPELIDKIK